MTGPLKRHPEIQTIVFYDGVCGFCNSWVNWIVVRDRKVIFHFAPLQGSIAKEILGDKARDLDTVWLLQEDALYSKSDAVLRVLRSLSGKWKVLSYCLGWLPRTVRNWGYDQIASRRYHLFSKLNRCPMPTPELRQRFLMDGL